MYCNLSFLRRFSHSRYSDLSSLYSNIRTCVQQGFYQEALQLYSTLLRSSLKPHKSIFPSLLKACACLFDLNHGRKVHAMAVEMGLQSDSYIGSALISMYGKCGSLEDAFQVFDQISERDVTLWNAMIDGYFLFGLKEEGIVLFQKMQSLGVRADGYSLSILLGICSEYSSLRNGEQIHAYVIRNAFDCDPFLGTALIDMYAKCMRPVCAWWVFNRLIEKTVFAWNALIAGLCLNGWWEKSLDLFRLMKNECCELHAATYSSVLTACSYGKDAFFGMAVHGDIIKMGLECDSYASTSILTMYAKCGLVEYAYQVFDNIHDKEIELWNAMISAYIGTGNFDGALHIYNEIKLSGFRPDSFTISNVLSACSMCASFDLGNKLHAELIKRPLQSNMAVQSAVLTLYAKCGNIEAAKSIFDAIERRDVVAWGSMISGLCQNGKFEEALDLFKTMSVEGLVLDSTVMVTVINACTGIENTCLGCQIHGNVITSGCGLDVYVSSALIDMYSKFGLVEFAGSVFSAMTCKNIVTWNSIISCYGRNGHPDQAIKLFSEILQHGLIPDSISIASVLVAVSWLAGLIKGKMIHAFQIRRGIQSDILVDNALIDMYVKCGCLQYASNLFNKMADRSIVAWNSMISGYGSHGHCLRAIELYKEMQNSAISPDEITFLALISSCSHSGMVEVGRGLFQSMTKDYGITPRMEHYTNMVDLYGRAGCLDEAYNFIQSMSIEPDESVWFCFLCSCRAYNQIVLGELAAEQLLKLDPERSGNYVQLLNLYGEAGLWEKAANLRLLMKEKGLKKSPGCSWIEVKDRVDVFCSGDSSPWTLEIHATLKSLRKNMKGGSLDVGGI